MNQWDITDTPQFLLRARAVGITDGWPYGPNIDPHARVDLVVWAERRGLRYSADGDCLHWISKGRCVVRNCREFAHTRSWLDHVTGWTRDGKAAALVAQPYDLNKEDLRDILAATEEFNLDVSIEGTRWYGRGTVFVMLFRPGEYPSPE